jgi:hypothetical protein
MKTTIEPNKIAVSLINLPALITGSFVALYMMAIAATKGNNHSIDWGLGPNISGSVKVAIINIIFSTILSSRRPYTAQMR